jgi:GTPase SAR1 family protein
VQNVIGALPDTVNPTIGTAFVTIDLILTDQSIQLLILDNAGQEVYCSREDVLLERAN